MKFLALDTTKASSYIIVVNGNNVNIKTLTQTRKVSEMLLSSIDEILNNSDLNLEEMDFLACVSGPGSFTGLRIGMSTIKGFNAALNKKLVSLNSFEVFADCIKNGCVMLSCTKTSFYYAIIKNNEIVEMGVDDLVNVENDKYSIEKKFVCEEELKNYADVFIDDYPQLLLNAFKAKIKSNHFTSKNEFKPFYLQQSQAERNLKNIKIN